MKSILPCVLLLITLTAISHCRAPAPSPLWDLVFTTNFTQHDTANTIMEGIWYYDYTAIRQRTDRNSGRYDSMHCKSLDSYCVTLVDDKYTWVYWPELKKCCSLCSVSDGCGIIKYDWLKNSTFEGYEYVNGYESAKWFIQGNQKNYYWNTKRATPYRAMVEMQAVDPGNFKMTFHPKTYNTNPIDPKVFALPSYCNANVQC